jgi:hypothetical protein
MIPKLRSTASPFISVFTRGCLACPADESVVDKNKSTELVVLNGARVSPESVEGNRKEMHSFSERERERERDMMSPLDFFKKGFKLFPSQYSSYY